MDETRMKAKELAKRIVDATLENPIVVVPVILLQGTATVHEVIHHATNNVKERILKALEETKYVSHWAEGMCRLFFNPETEPEEYRKCVERAKERLAEKLLER